MSKIVGIGMHKTGTKTLRKALSILGYRVCERTPELFKAFFAKDYDSIWNLVDSHDAFEDHPWPFIFKKLDKKYPDSKFILTIRDEQDWIKSVDNAFGKRPSQMRKWIYGVGWPRNNEQVFLNRFKQHNTEVRKYFQNRESDFLEICWAEGDCWEKICGFLKLDIPDVPFPHENPGSYKFHQKIIKFVESWNWGRFIK